MSEAHRAIPAKPGTGDSSLAVFRSTIHRVTFKGFLSPADRRGTVALVGGSILVEWESLDGKVLQSFRFR